MSTLKKIKAFLRKRFDSLFCKKINGLRFFGQNTGWHILEPLMTAETKVVSGGVGNNMTFELEIADQIGCEIFLFDPSETGIKTHSVPNNQRQNIHFHDQGLSGISGPVEFMEPIRAHEGSFTVSESGENRKKITFECVSVSDVVKQQGISDGALLKIDIEGFEYEVLKDILANCPNTFSQICVEYHHFMNTISIGDTLRSISSLLQKDYRIVHKNGTEYLFVRSEMLKLRRKNEQL